MKNWKTSLAGIIGAISTALIPIVKGKGFEPESLVIAAVLAILGLLAKDKDTTGAGTNARKVKEDQ